MNQGGHQEVQGETIAKFEFFDHGFNPYSRYLDVDKVDLILRKKVGNAVAYREVQVKFGRLYECGPKWEQSLFDVTSWRFFRTDEFRAHRPDLFVAYVLSNPRTGYQGDIFIFPSQAFHELIHAAIPVKGGDQRKMYLSRSKTDHTWHLRTAGRFDAITPQTTRSVQEFRRNFGVLDQ